jgi:hypothetical protein
VKHKTKSKKLPLSERTKVRVPVSYGWDILNALNNDFSPFIGENEFNRVRVIARARDINKYLELSDDWGLQRMNHCDAYTFEKKCLYQLAALLKKFQFEGDEDARRSAAIDTFEAAELACLHYNHVGYKSLSQSDNPFVIHAYTYAMAFCRKVLGESPEAERITYWSRHGPGATLDTVRGLTSQYNKFEEWPYTVTSRAFGRGVSLISKDARWMGALENSYRQELHNSGVPNAFTVPLNWRTFWHDVLMMVDGNRITTVPKSVLTDRTIAIEPTINLFLQLGVDGFIRQRLKYWGIDLNDQEPNREQARIGSISGYYATIDMKAASDSISLKLCEQLLPTDWYDLLVDLRSPCGTYEKRSYSFSKVSSMGNGYTFALESLIFSSLIYGGLRALDHEELFSTCRIYGDDLIIPTEFADKIIHLLKCAGFQINIDKSFTKGCVRESCGADWFKGIPVRPVQLNAVPVNVNHLFNDHNRILKMLFHNFGADFESECISLILKWVPNEFKEFYGPISDEDTFTYLHSFTSRHMKYSGQYWRYKRLLRLPIAYSAKDFFFRKLMCYLRPGPQSLQAGKGSVFDPCSRKRSRVSIQNSAASNWQTEYTSPFYSRPHSRS